MFVLVIESVFVCERQREEHRERELKIARQKE